MQPTINETDFGSITIEGERIHHDIIVEPDGKIRDRNKQLSRKHFGTSHNVSREEAEHIWTQDADHIIIGTGQYGNLSLTEEAKEFFRSKNCEFQQHHTPKAIDVWNNIDGNVEGMFHVTC